MKKLLLLFALCASVTTWAQTVVKDVSADGKTLTLTCSGDLSAYEGTFAANGYKFGSNAVNVVFSDEKGTSVANNELYSSVKPYYTRTQQYKTQAVPYTTQYTLSQNVYSLNGSNYVVSNLGSTIEDGKTYFLNDETEQEIEDMSDYTETSVLFSDKANGWIYEATIASWDGSIIPGESVAGKIFNKDGLYMITGQQYSGWDANRKIISSQELKDGEYLIDAIKIKQDVNVYTIDGTSYNLASGSLYDDAKTYYSGVSFTSIDNIKESEYANSKVIITPESNVQYYVRTGEESNYSYNKIYAGNDYDENATYCVEDGFKYDVIASPSIDSYIYETKVADNFWQALVVECNANGYKNLIFKSEDEENKAQINNYITQELMNLTTVRVLDLSGTQIETIVSPYKDTVGSSSNYDWIDGVDYYYGTFMSHNVNEYGQSDRGQTMNNSVETLYTPVVSSEEFELPYQAFGKFQNLHHLYLSDGIKVLGENSISRSPFYLSTIIFPNTLEVIKSNAVSGHFVQSRKPLIKTQDGEEIDYIATLTFPAGLKKIETDAFAGTCPKDVYFLGEDAPIVEKHAWGDNAYISNNAFTNEVTLPDGTKALVDTGLATRMNYTNQSGWIAMLHYPSTCSKAQAAKYTDVTRDYRRVAYNTYAETGGVDPNDSEMSFYNQYTYYTPGKETSPLSGNGNATTDNAHSKFGNEYNPDDPNLSQWKEYGGWFGGDYAGGYYDMTSGSQIMWPSIVMAYRATVAAQKDVIWNGVTSIGDGIRNAIEEHLPNEVLTEYEGDGSEYIGLHQFVLAAADANPGKTNEWDMEKFCDGRWHTICLPFNMTKGQMKETFGAIGKDDDGNLQYHIKLCKFDKVVRSPKNLQLCFNDEQFNNAENDDDIVLQAHISYMIYAKKDNAVMGENFTAKMKNYVIEAGGVPLPTEVLASTSAEDASEDEPSVASLGYYRFVGNYTTYTNDPTGMDVVRVPQYSYFYRNPEDTSKSGNFYFQLGTSEGPNKTSAKWNPYTSVVYTPYGQGEADLNTYFKSSAAGSKIRTVILDEVEMGDEATGIETVTMEADGELIYTNAKVYNLNGQFVGNSIENLPTGIYVVNGKKYLIK